MSKFSSEHRKTYERYAKLNLPRHTSYPIVPVWKKTLTHPEKGEMLQSIEAQEVSLYVHIPFCRSLCYYCGCTREIVGDDLVKKQTFTERFLINLEQEISATAAQLGQKNAKSLHFGGGTPTFLNPLELKKVVQLLKKYFDFSALTEFSCEIDPRVTTRAHLEALRSEGCTRLSLGVQDFNESVQKLVNRIQPFDEVREFMTMVREVGFSEVNFDLIYGLPGQTLESVGNTIDLTLTLRPTRIAFYRLAVIPEIFKWQKSFARTDLPQGEVTMEMMLSAIEKFETGGYKYIGLDHFALPDDKLFAAMDEGSITRNFQGMSTGNELAVIGFGPSAISSGTGFFYQNAKSFYDWSQAIEETAAKDPVVRGLSLSANDRMRQELLLDLYSYGAVDLKHIAEKHGREWKSEFDRELAECRELEAEDLVTIESSTIKVKGLLGRMLVRVVAAIFDGYLPAGTFRKGLPAGQSSKAG